MAEGTRQSDFKILAQVKIDDAQHLYSTGRFSNAYYLAGYAVEFAIKAYIAGRFVANTIPTDNSCRTYSCMTLTN